MTTRSAYWQTAKNVIWLSFGLGCVLASFIFWILQLAPRGVEEIVDNPSAQETARPVKNEKVTISDSLGSFTKLVAPIELSQRSVEPTVHDREFRGAKYVAEHQKKWTLQLMKISEEEIVKAYLTKRSDRNQFNYLRLQDGKNPDYYVLIYGVYDSEQQALENAQRVNFNLPTSIEVVAAPFANYLPLVNDMGSDELMTSSKLRDVNLTRTYTPPPAAVVKPQPAPPVAVENTQLPQNNAAATAPNQHEKQQKQPTSVQKPAHDEPKKDIAGKNKTSDAQIADPF